MKLTSTDRAQGISPDQRALSLHTIWTRVSRPCYNRDSLFSDDGRAWYRIYQYEACESEKEIIPLVLRGIFCIMRKNMFGLFNLFSKKNPSIDVTLEVSMPEYVYSPSEHASEYVPPPPAKIPENACCPYCWVVFDKPPTRKKKCVDCGWYIYVRTSEERVKLYLTEEQVHFHDRLYIVKSWSQGFEARWFSWLSDEEKERCAKDDAYFASLVEEKLMNETRVALANINFFDAYMAQRSLHEFYENRVWYTWWFLKNAERFRKSWEKQLQKECEKMMNS